MPFGIPRLQRIVFAKLMPMGFASLYPTYDVPGLGVKRAASAFHLSLELDNPCQ